MIIVMAEHNQEIEKQLLTVPVHDLTRVVQTKEDDVEHQRNVYRPIDAVTVKIQTVDNEIGEKNDG